MFLFFLFAHMGSSKFTGFKNQQATNGLVIVWRLVQLFSGGRPETAPSSFFAAVQWGTLAQGKRMVMGIQLVPLKVHPMIKFRHGHI